MIRALHLQRAFTLIELLVVISIIGMLSSVVLAAVGGARDKGTVGAALQFAGHTYQAFGADSILYSDFNNGSLANQSYYNFSASNGAAGTFSTTDTPNGRGQSYVLDGLGTNIGGQYNLTTAMSAGAFSGYTVSMWIKPSSTAVDGWLFYSDTTTDCSNTNSRLASLYWFATGGLQVAIYAGGNALNQWNDSVTNYVPKSKWTHVAYSYSAGAGHTLFINGKRQSVTMLTGATGVSTSVSCVRLGYFSNATTQTFKGNLDDVAIYNQALAAGDIEKLYAAGLPTHNLAQK